METLAAYPPTTPRTQTSNIRESRPRPAVGLLAQQATRSMQPSDPQQQPLSAPASQESFVSVQSTGSSVGPRLQSSSSNVSQLTNYTDVTSPSSSAPTKDGHALLQASQPDGRAHTPEHQTQQNGNIHPLASPMSIVSPASVNGAKRTASGHVKSAPSLPNTPMDATFGRRRSRGESISSTGSRAGELAASLKTRLGYAMAKVQHGWENKSIAEVEQLAAHKVQSNRHSMSHTNSSSRPMSAGLSNGFSRVSMYESYGRGALDGAASPPSKRHSGTYASFVSPPQQYAPSLSSAPRLQPAADIRPTTSTHQVHRVLPSSQTSNPQSVMSPPRTPLPGQQRRPPTIRTDTQTAEAERDALQALFQLGSPHGSQMARQNAASQASSTQASPLRTEFATPRKVTFARSESDSSAVSSSSSINIQGGRDHVVEPAGHR